MCLEPLEARQLLSIVPTLSIDGAESALEGGTYTLQLSSEPEPPTIDHWNIHWGDGQIEPVSGDPSSVDHVYADGDATYRVFAEATDEEENTYSVGDPGTPNAVFGEGGWVATSLAPGADYEYAVAPQADGKLVVAGTGDDRAFRVTRYNVDGTLDPDFGTGGTVTTCVGMASDARAVVIQGDRKIVVAGDAVAIGYQFAVVRYNADGSLDTGFDGDGRVLTDMSGGNDYAYGVAIQSDGKIVVAGYGSNYGNSNFALARYNADGSLDTAFDTDGRVLTGITGGYDYAYAMTIQSDGKIVAAGTTSAGYAWYDMLVVRCNADGSLDTGFGTGGKVRTDFAGSADKAFAVTLQPDGKIVAAGNAYNVSNNDIAVARYSTNGTLDTDFGTGGKVLTGFDKSWDNARAMAVRRDGKIVLAGEVCKGAWASGAASEMGSGLISGLKFRGQTNPH